MLVIRMPPIIEDRLHFPEVTAGIEPVIDVLGLDVDDGAIVARRGDFRLRVVKKRCQGPSRKGVRDNLKSIARNQEPSRSAIKA